MSIPISKSKFRFLLVGVLEYTFTFLFKFGNRNIELFSVTVCKQVYYIGILCLRFYLPLLMDLKTEMPMAHFPPQSVSICRGDSARIITTNHNKVVRIHRHIRVSLLTFRRTRINFIFNLNLALEI